MASDELHRAVDQSLAGLYGDAGIAGGLPSPVTTAMRIASDLRRAGWRPPAEVITAPSDLDALPERTVIVIGGYAFQRFGGWWHGSGGVMPVHSEQLIDMHEGEAATVVWSPTKKAGDR